MKILQFLLILLICNNTVSCQQKKEKMRPLTERHLLTHLSMNYLFQLDNLTEQQIEEERNKLIYLYHEDPKGTLDLLEEHLNNNPHLKAVFKDLNKSILDTNTRDKSKIMSSRTNTKNTNLPEGFTLFRKQLSKKQLALVSNKNTKKIRDFLCNKQLRYEKVTSYGNFGSSTSIEVIQLCANGYFTYLSNDGISAQVDQIGGISQGKEKFLGTWEISFENNINILWLHSTDPQFIALSITGFIPFNIKNIENTVVRIENSPKDKLYRITQINCN